MVGVGQRVAREGVLQADGVKIDRPFTPASSDAEAVMKAVGADPAFIQLCRIQESFRARLRQVHTPAPGRTLHDICRDSYGMLLDMAESQEEVLRIQLRERDAADARVREFLREERTRWIESLARDYDRIAAAGGLRIDATLAAELMVALSMGTIAGYLEGRFPPGERDPDRRRRANEVFVDAHAKASAAIREAAGAPVGLTLAMSDDRALPGGEVLRQAANGLQTVTAQRAAVNDFFERLAA